MRNRLSSWRNFAELYFLPASAALLPWGFAFRWLRFWAGFRWPFALETQAAIREASNIGMDRADEQWIQKYKLVKFVDHADLYFSLTRTDRWLTKWVTVSGEWPRQGPFIAFTYHWGTGLWVLRHLRRAGLQAAMLSTPLDNAAPILDLRARYGQLRNWEVQRATAEAVIYLGGARDKIRDHLRSGGAIVALVDVPRNQTPESLEVTVLGRETSLPRGLFALSSEESIPMIPFVFVLDCETGSRRLEILPALAGADEKTLANEAARIFGNLLERDSAAWHRWPDASYFFPAKGVGNALK